jgi:hypothetical protein
VIPQHGVAGWKPIEQLAQLPLAAGIRDEVAADQRQVWTPMGHPLDRALDRLLASGWQAEMEVREVRDAQSIELPQQAAHRHAELLQAYPARLEVPPRKARGGDRERRLQASPQSDPSPAAPVSL